MYLPGLLLGSFIFEAFVSSLVHTELAFASCHRFTSYLISFLMARQSPGKTKAVRLSNVSLGDCLTASQLDLI
jgi:hypothetical protein